MNDLSVLWISHVCLTQGMYTISHYHDYFHFSYKFREEILREGKKISLPPLITCIPPLTENPAFHVKNKLEAINFMFLVEDKKLHNDLASFPFSDIPEEKMHEDLLFEIVRQISEMTPNSDFVNNAFLYYLRLLLIDNEYLIKKDSSRKLIDRCNEYIEAHYADDLKLEDIAAYIGRNRTYTSTLYSSSTGNTIVERINQVRAAHSCDLLAYTDGSMETIATKCGFHSVRNFTRVFRKYVGVPPGHYRSSHNVSDLRCDGNEKELMWPYPLEKDYFTYAVMAQKKVQWKNPYDYLRQMPKKQK